MKFSLFPRRPSWSPSRNSIDGSQQQPTAALSTTVGVMINYSSCDALKPVSNELGGAAWWLITLIQEELCFNTPAKNDEFLGGTPNGFFFKWLFLRRDGLFLFSKYW